MSLAIASSTSRFAPGLTITCATQANSSRNPFPAPCLGKPLLSALPGAGNRIENLRDAAGIGVGIVKRGRKQRPRERSLLNVGPLREPGELERVSFVQGEVDALRIGAHEPRIAQKYTSRASCRAGLATSAPAGFEPATVGLEVQPEGVRGEESSLRGAILSEEFSWVRWSRGPNPGPSSPRGRTRKDGHAAYPKIFLDIVRVTDWPSASTTVSVTRTRAVPSFRSACLAGRGRATRIGVVEPAPRVPLGATVPR